MRDRRARAITVGIILAMPVFMLLASREPGAAARGALTVVGVEAVLVGGLLTAARERRLLAAEAAVAAVRLPSPSPSPAPRRVPSLPHVRPAAPAPVAVRASSR